MGRILRVTYDRNIMGNGFVSWFSRWYKGIIIGLSSFGVVMLVVLAMQHASGSVAADATAGPIPTFSSTAISSNPKVEDAMKRLDKGSLPWTMTVLGDSTGNGEDEWVYSTAATLSKKWNRPVTVHDWDTETNQYTADHRIGSGSNAPVTIWNMSASGKDAAYSLANLKTGMPEKSDLVIVSHGHNEVDGPTAVSAVRQLVLRANQQYADRPAVAIVLQSPRSTDTPQVQASVVSALRAAYQSGPYKEIDVFTPFSKTDLSETIGPDGRHPTAAGETLWANVVADALGVS